MIMSKQNETGHAVNVAHFDQLREYAISFRK
jgi:hypothetical protein